MCSVPSDPFFLAWEMSSWSSGRCPICLIPVTPTPSSAPFGAHHRRPCSIHHILDLVLLFPDACLDALLRDAAGSRSYGRVSVRVQLCNSVCFQFRQVKEFTFTAITPSASCSVQTRSVAKLVCSLSSTTTSRVRTLSKAKPHLFVIMSCIADMWVPPFRPA
jgi:hypothetical protein